MNSRNIMVYVHYLPFAEKGLACDFIRARQSLAEDFQTRVVGRGTVRGKGYRIESDYPLGLFNVVKRRRGTELLKVYPRPMLTATVKSTVASGGEGNSLMSFMYNNDGEICGSREFQKGDKITYLSHPGVITGVNKTPDGKYTYNVSYDKGEGKTKVPFIFNKGGEIKKA